MSAGTGEIDPQELRRLDLEGPVNFRDLGGYAAAGGRTVRRRHLFRSDALFRLTDADVARVHALGVTTVIDFRTTHELESNGWGGIELLDAEHLHLPTFDTTRPLVEDEAIMQTLVTAPDAYVSMLRNGAQAYATALRHVARSVEPVVFFCAAGKDRTGVFAAMVLGLLGVSDDDIVADYALTGEVIDRIHALRTVEDPQVERRAHRIGADLQHAYPESMVATLTRVHAEWGDWAGYTASIGVEPAVLDELRARLLV
ncbi:MAG: tyrosine-protein phosphatase [Actinomycetota bacterium]